MTSELMASVGKLTQMAIENGKQRDVAIARTEAAEAALAERDKPCMWRWKMDDSEQHWSHWWYADCGHMQEDRVPEEWDFCPYCGHPIEVAE